MCWIHGADDAIISDSAVTDVGFLGKIGVVPGWPGEDVFPPSPMFSQIRHFLEKYQGSGGFCQVHILPETGHTPFLEKPEECARIILSFLSRQA